METSEQYRAKLNRDLYLAARDCLNPSYRNDGQAVRAKRDYACEQLCGKPYDELNISQLLDVINELKRQHGEKVKQYASSRQINTLHFYGLACALTYCDFAGLTLTFGADINGRRDGIEGENLRIWLRNKFDKKEKMPANCVQWLFRKWLNPTANKYLVEGEHRKAARNAESLYYESLSIEEAQYLISRFKQMFSNLQHRTAGAAVADDAAKN